MTKYDNEINVLLVDDEPEFLEAASGALSRRGFIVSQALDGRTALELIQTRAFEVVVLDVKMPGIDGIEVFNRIKILAPDLPIIMLTGHGTIKQAFETSRDGVFEYLNKPCDIEKLAEILRKAVEQAKSALSRAQGEEVEEEIRLLLVDDDTDFIESLAPSLRRRGIKVTTSLGAAEAQEKTKNQIFDVALVDVSMPGQDGIEFLIQINKLDTITPVILITGQPSMEKLVKAVKEGAFDILQKPIGIELLIGKIREAFRTRQIRIAKQRVQAVKRILEENPD